MEPLIVQLEGLLKGMRPDYFALLQPGVTDDELDEFSRRFEVPLPALFRALYKWRNGQLLSASDRLHRNWMFCSLEEVTDSKDILDGMIGFDFDSPEYWRRAWIPFLHNGGGSYLCVDTAGEDGRRPGQLVAFWKADADRPVEYETFEDWVRAVIASLKAGNDGS